MIFWQTISLRLWLLYLVKDREKEPEECQMVMAMCGIGGVPTSEQVSAFV